MNARTHISRTQISTLMQLLHALVTFVQCSVNGSGHGERSTDNGAYTNQETRETLASCFPVDNLHRGNILLDVSI